MPLQNIFKSGGGGQLPPPPPLPPFSYTTGLCMHVIRNLKTKLLGLPAIQALQIVQRLNAVEAHEQSIREQFPKLFTGLGNFGEDYDIQIKEGAVPHCVFTPRHVTFPMREKVQEQLLSAIKARFSEISVKNGQV